MIVQSRGRVVRCTVGTAHPLSLKTGRRCPLSKEPRRGSLLAEVAMAVVMLMIAMTLTVKVLGYVGQQRRVSEHRQRAIQEVANVMERLTAHPFEEITAEQARRVTLSPSARQSLPEADLAVGVAEDHPGAGRSAKRIAVRLRWRGRAGEWEAPVRLTTWIERGRPAP